MPIQTSRKYPASLIQEQFWLINKLQPDNPAYNIPSLFHLKGHLNIEALTKSLNEISSRHDIFRTVFSREGHRLYQVVTNETQLTFQTVTLNNLPREEQQEQIHHLVQKEVTTPFDLANGPLFRVIFFSLGKQEHILLLMMHHIITDLRSKEIFSSELSALYRAFTLNLSPELSAPVHQYKDFALWQQDWLNGEKCTTMLDYWQRSLKEHSGYLNLPTGKPRPPVLTISGDAHSFHLSYSLTDTFKKFSRSKNTNIFLTLLTAYNILLFRYTDQKDIVTGVPLTNRRKDTHKNIAGCFVNILPVAINVSGDKNFAETLQQVRQAMLGAHRNQELPYDLMIKKLQSKRDPSFNPLFQTGFTFEPPMELDLYDLETRPEKIHNRGAQLDLFLTLWEENDEIHGFAEFNGELFEKTTIQRFVGHYTTLLQEIIAHPEKKIHSLNILTDQEKHQQPIQWNATGTSLPKDPLLHRLFESQTDKTPDSIAVIAQGSQCTYLELNSRANQLAHYLHRLGVKPGELIGVCINRSLDMIVALYAILKAGGAYVPLDPAFPRDRIAFMLEDTGLKLILTEEKVADQLPDHDSRKIRVDTSRATIKDEPECNPDTKISPENSAYVIYTSGSTGKPKGVQVPHKAIVNFLLSMSKKPGITAQDTLLAVTTLSFDISVLELFLPLAVGGTTVIADQETASNGELLLDLLQASKATVMQATPITWHLLIAAGWEGEEDFKVLCGGEPLPRDLAVQLTQRSSKVWNLYGPTETTVWSTCCKVSDADSQILVGKPIANTQIYIVNQGNQPNPIGVSGEMLIGGTGVTKGYLNRPALTTEKFIPDIFRQKTSDHKLYKTGDLACWLPDGSIKMLGRIDSQVKLRGYRIELGEIEAVLEKHPAIRQAAVIVREDDPGDKRLTAYTVLNNDQSCSGAELKRYLSTKLPEYMVPSIFIPLETMSLTLNGKIDRRALPRPEQRRAALEQRFTPPGSEIEKRLSRLWSQTLKIDKVGTHDNFFDMGGNSLLSVHLVALLEKEMRIQLPIVKFYQYPTIESLAKYISAQENSRQHPGKKIQNRAQLQKNALARRQRQARRKRQE